MTVWLAHPANVGFSDAEVEKYRNEDLDPLRIYLSVLFSCLIASSLMLFVLMRTREIVQAAREDDASAEGSQHDSAEYGGENSWIDRLRELLIFPTREPVVEAIDPRSRDSNIVPRSREPVVEAMDPRSERSL